MSFGSTIPSALLMAAIVAATALTPSAGMAQSLMRSTAAATKVEVLKHVPIGTSVGQAKTFMEANGFRCVLSQKQLFGEDGPTPGQQITHGPADFLWCDSGERTFRLVLTRRWQVELVIVDGKISYVATSVGVTGL